MNGDIMFKIQDTKIIHEYQRELIKHNFPKELLASTSLYQYEANEMVIQSDTIISKVFIFVEGTCIVYKDLKNGDVGIISHNHQFQIYGEVELINQTTTQTNIKCTQPSYIFELEVTNSLRNNVAFLHFCMQHLSKKLNTYDYNHLINGHYDLEMRLASFILKYAKKDIFNIDEQLTANYLGCSKRHLL